MFLTALIRGTQHRFSHWALSGHPWSYHAQVRPVSLSTVATQAPSPTGRPVRVALRSFLIGPSSADCRNPPQLVTSPGAFGQLQGNHIRQSHGKPGTRPGILPCNGNEAASHRIHLHIPRCSHKVTLVKNAGTESSLEQVTTGPSGEVPHACATPVSRPERPGREASW